MRITKIRIASGVALLAMTSVLISGCSDAKNTASAGSETNFVAGDGSIEVVAVEKRVPAPDFTLPTLTGADFTLSKQLGKVVVMNVWASWCAPCRAEAPALQDVWKKSDQKKVQFVGLDTRDSDTAAQNFVDRYGISYPQAIDPEARVQLLFRDTLPAQAIPSTLIVDAKGNVAARILGATTEAALRSVIDDVQKSTA
jgi:peroxiredoxin